MRKLPSIRDRIKAHSLVEDIPLCMEMCNDWTLLNSITVLKRIIIRGICSNSSNIPHAFQTKAQLPSHLIVLPIPKTTDSFQRTTTVLALLLDTDYNKRQISSSIKQQIGPAQDPLMVDHLLGIGSFISQTNTVGKVAEGNLSRTRRKSPIKAHTL
jgi:hypothetical protein